MFSLFSSGLIFASSLVGREVEAVERVTGRIDGDVIAPAWTLEDDSEFSSFVPRVNGTGKTFRKLRSLLSGGSRILFEAAAGTA